MPLFLILHIDLFDGKRKFEFLVICQFNDATITRSNLILVLYILRQDQFNFLIGENISDSGLIHTHVNAIGIYLYMFLVSITKMKLVNI